jgi:hypothetical protein
MIGSRELLKGAVPAILFLVTLGGLLWWSTRSNDAPGTTTAAASDALPATAPGCAFVEALPDNAYGGTVVRAYDLQPIALVDVYLISPQGAVAHQQGEAPSGGALNFDFFPGAWNQIYVHTTNLEGNTDEGGCYLGAGAWGWQPTRAAQDSNASSPVHFDGQFPAGERAPGGWILDSNGNIAPAPATSGQQVSCGNGGC